MASKVTITELRKMPLKDLEREIRGQRALVAKLRLAVHMRKEKNTAKYQHEKLQLARMLTVLEEIAPKQLPAKAAEPKVPAQSAS